MKSPAFQFYPNDWLSSTRIALMTPAEEGGYIRLLCHDWTNDGIPNDDDQLAALSRLGDAWFNGSAQVLKACFSNHPAKVGFLTNPRLQDERQKQAEWREAKRDGGVKGANRRWGRDVPVDQWFRGDTPVPDRKNPSDQTVSDGSPIGNPSEKDGSSSSSSPSSTREPPLGGPPSLNEVLAWGEQEAIPQEACERFFNHNEGLGWMCGQTPIRHPRAWLRKFWASERRVKLGGGMRRESAGSVVFQKKTRMEALEKLLQDHAAHPGAAYSDPPTPEQRKEYRAMMDEAQRLRHELARGVVAHGQSPKSPESNV